MCEVETEAGWSGPLERSRKVCIDPRIFTERTTPLMPVLAISDILVVAGGDKLWRQEVLNPSLLALFSPSLSSRYRSLPVPLDSFSWDKQ